MLIVLLSTTQIRKKIMSAKTDSLDNVKYDEQNQPGISNLIEIYSVITNKSIKEIEKEFKGKQYGEFKKEVANKVCDEIKDIQEKFNYWKSHYNEIENKLFENAKKCQKIASNKMEKIYKTLGLK